MLNGVKLCKVFVFFSIWLLVIGCSEEPGKDQSTQENLLSQEWDQTVGQAKGQKVNMYMWGGSESINRYIDEWVGPRLKESFGVELKRVPVSDIKESINQLLVEKKAGKAEGSMDILWINGENFKTAKENGLLWGPFAGQLPSFKQYIDENAADIQYDFGLKTDGYEAPWGKAQFVFVYDQKNVPQPPKNWLELKQWIKEHPGKFTYPSPPDFTGSAFIRHALYDTTGGYKQYMVPFEEKTTEEWGPLWKELNEIEPYLWREGKTYPESLAKLDQLYANGEVWMTMGYDPGRAQNEIQKGMFPASSRTLVFDTGTLSNTHYLAIPFHSKNQAGAMVAINFLLSPEAQIRKIDPAHWGEEMALDPKKLSQDDRKKVESIDRGEASLSSEELAQHRLPEIPAEYVDALEKGWSKHVAKP